jgi:hypothetical protein
MRQIAMLTVVLLMLFSIVHGEDTYEDVVYLKNGSIIHGMIIEQLIGKSIKIQTRDKNIFVYSYDEIEKITKEPVISEKNLEQIKPQSVKQQAVSSNRYYGILRIGLRSGESNTLFNGNIINGAKFGKYFSCGFGFGYDNYPNGHMLPLFLDLRGYFASKPVIPSIYLDAGYSLAWVNYESGAGWGGFMLAAGAGLHIPISGDFSVLVNVGYKMQKAKERYYYFYNYGGNWYYWDEKRTATYDFFTVDVGIAF